MGGRMSKRGLSNSVDGINALIKKTEDKTERKFYQYVLEQFDFKRFAQIQAAHSVESSSRGWLKFLDFPHYLTLRYQYVRDLGLDRCEPLRILDLACGPAHFGYICQYFGHEVTCLDVPDDRIFNDMVALLGVTRIAEAIMPAKPLPPTPKFDLITSFHATFHRKKGNTLFTAAEWIFFLEDLISNHTSVNAKVVLQLDRLPNSEGLHVFDQKFSDLISRHGGEVRQGRVVCFDDVSNCPSQWLTPSRLVSSGDEEVIADAIRLLLDVGRTNSAVQLAEAAGSKICSSSRPECGAQVVRAFVESDRPEQALAMANKMGDSLDTHVWQALKTWRELAS